METSDYTQKIQDLRKRVEYHGINNIENKNIPITTFPTFPTIPTILKNLNFPKPIIYILPIIGVGILLFLSKPSFITMDNLNIDIDNNTENEITKKIIYSNIIIYSLLGGFTIDIIIWVYLNKKK